MTTSSNKCCYRCGTDDDEFKAKGEGCHKSSCSCHSPTVNLNDTGPAFPGPIMKCKIYKCTKCGGDTFPRNSDVVCVDRAPIFPCNCSPTVPTAESEAVRTLKEAMKDPYFPFLPPQKESGKCEKPDCLVAHTRSTPPPPKENELEKRLVRFARDWKESTEPDERGSALAEMLDFLAQPTPPPTSDHKEEEWENVDELYTLVQREARCVNGHIESCQWDKIKALFASTSLLTEKRVRAEVVREIEPYVNTLIGYLEAIRDGKYPVGIAHTEIPAVIEESNEWLSSLTHNTKRE